MKQTKISKALAYLQANPGCTQNAAAKHAGISASQLYRRLLLDKSKAAGVCQTCGAKTDDTVKVTLTLRRSEVEKLRE